MVTSSSTSTAEDASTATVASELEGAHEHAGGGFTEYPAPPSREILDAAGELLRALAAPACTNLSTPSACPSRWSVSI
jgi:ArsR family transcriptional regulator, zinc-responsive transcriptional repressor